MKFQHTIMQKQDATTIDNLFLLHLQQNNPLLLQGLQHFRHANIELPSGMLMELAKCVEAFLLEFFDISVNNAQFCEDLPHVKRNFVQRRVFVKYNNEEVSPLCEESYVFTTEERFVKDILSANEQTLSEMELFTAYVLFTTSGQKEYGNYEVFCLPQAVENRRRNFHNTGNVILANATIKREGFNLTDTPPPQKTIDWNLYYCLYCHNRGKDSCSKGLNAEKKGCPLRQDISESILLKKENYPIGALAVIMRNNPLCIITGRRICNDCEIACIFQKQDSVDIQSVETHIINDVLNLKYGFEVYYLLLLWNPLNIAKLPNLNGKTVGVAGGGPAGLFCAYLFSKNEASVIVFDALSIQVPQKLLNIKENIIENIEPFLNQKLENRTPSGIGGVMEYGITARWNKNYLDLLIGILLRLGVNFAGTIRIGGLINYYDIFTRFKFNHFALCVGSALPSLPFYLPNLFTNYALTNGVVMASDFLMSLHINRNSKFLESFRYNSVYILGCGLTAIDTACEIRALLIKNGVNIPNVKIIYYNNFTSSSAYTKNFLEFQKAMQEGIGVLHNTKITKIHKTQERICAIQTQDGSTLECDLFVIAIGTNPNTKHIEEFLNKPDVSFFGDCNPLYTGSVVKALASVKDGVLNSFTATLANGNIASTQIFNYLQKTITNIIQIEENVHEIEITSPVLFEKAQPGNVVKLQEMYQNSIALTITHKNAGKIYGYLFNSNSETQSLIATYYNNSTIYINGINCKNTPEIDCNTTIIASPKIRFILQKIFPNNSFIEAQYFAEVELNNNQTYFVAIEDALLLGQVVQKLQGIKHCLLAYNKMNCMLGGVCGRCVTPNGSYSCL